MKKNFILLIKIGSGLKLQFKDNLYFPTLKIKIKMMILNKIQFQIKMSRFYIISKTKFAYLFNDILCIHVWKYFLDYILL